MDVRESILECIGNTPMIRLNRITKDVSANILVKCEFLNPSGSMKDRMALRMIESAEKEGKLKEGGIVTESSTGNTATALSFVSAAKGYKSVMHMPKGWIPDDKRKMLTSYGAEVVEVDPGNEIHQELEGKSVNGGVVEIIPRIRALKLEEENENVWWARQAMNPDNVLAHKETTGREIIEQTDGKVDAFVCAVGTGGTLLGVSEALLEVNPEVKIYAVEPASSSLLQMAPEIKFYMEKYGVPGVTGLILNKIEESGILEKAFLVEDEDAVFMARRLCQEEGLFCGMSAGANVHVCLEIAKELGPGKNVVTILADNRYRYLFSEHFTT
jgi:cysteine synthase